MLLAAGCVGYCITGAAAGQDAALRLPTGAYVRAANSAGLMPTQLTLEAWIRPAGPGGGGSANGATILVRSPEGSASGAFVNTWGVWWEASSQHINFGLMHQRPSSGVFLISNAVVPVGSEARVACTFDGVTMRLYVNGVLDTSTAFGFQGIDSYAADSVLIGAANLPGFARFFEGQIDDVRIWDHARTAAEIAEAMTCNPGIDEPGLLASWNFTGQSLADVSGHGHAGSAVGAAGYMLRPDIAGWPIVGQQPSDVRIGRTCSTASFRVTATGSSVIGYRWRKGGVPLDVVTHPSAATANLEIAGVGPGDADSYDCILTTSCGQAISHAATLVICASDFNCDGTVDFFDYLDFVSAFAVGGMDADFNADGVVDFFDYLDFVDAFSTGC